MGGLGGRLVGGVLADHRENGIGVRVVQSRYGLEGGSPSGRYSRRSRATSTSTWVMIPRSEPRDSAESPNERAIEVVVEGASGCP